jgi:hypothetical protein
MNVHILQSKVLGNEFSRKAKKNSSDSGTIQDIIA